MLETCQKIVVACAVLNNMAIDLKEKVCHSNQLIQRLTKRLVSGCENFLPALA